MNRRSFLTSLGTAAIGAAALALDDPERLLWVPGAKTIVDFGATKQVLPATDAEVVNQAYKSIIASTNLDPEIFRRDLRRLADDVALRDYRLDIGGSNGVTSFRYRDEKLVSVHSPEELKLLDQPFFGVNGQAALPRDRSGRTIKTSGYLRRMNSLIDVKEDYE